MMLKMVYHLPYRQLVGFITWMFLKIGISSPIPHFTTLAERARQLGKSFRRLSQKRPTDIVFDSSGFKI